MIPNTIGVIPGRFQEPDLHEGHRYLIGQVCEMHEHVMIMLGVPRGYLSFQDPLPYHMRMQMIQSAFPSRKFTFVQLERDRRAYQARSEKIDNLIEREFPGQNAILYGSRDSVLQKYAGRFPAHEIATVFPSSSTEIRDNIVPIDSADFRAGYMYRVKTLAPIAFPTVDLAVVDRLRKLVWLARKEHEDFWRFCGGFFDLIYDKSLEEAAAREGGEEYRGMQFGPTRIIGSNVIDDWRYWGTPHNVLTTLCVADYRGGVPTASDDIIDAMEFAYDEIADAVMPEHRVLVPILLRHLEETKHRWQ